MGDFNLEWVRRFTPLIVRTLSRGYSDLDAWAIIKSR